MPLYSIFSLIYLIHFYKIGYHLQVFKCLSSVPKSHPIFRCILQISYWTCPPRNFKGNLRLKIAIIIHNTHLRPCFFSSAQHRIPNKKRKLYYWSGCFSLPQHKIHLKGYNSTSWTFLYVQIHLTTSLSARYNCPQEYHTTPNRPIWPSLFPSN